MSPKLSLLISFRKTTLLIYFISKERKTHQHVAAKILLQTAARPNGASYTPSLRLLFLIFSLAASSILQAIGAPFILPSTAGINLKGGIVQSFISYCDNFSLNLGNHYCYHPLNIDDSLCKSLDFAPSRVLSTTPDKWSSGDVGSNLSTSVHSSLTSRRHADCKTDWCMPQLCIGAWKPKRKESRHMRCFLGIIVNFTELQLNSFLA